MTKTSHETTPCDVCHALVRDDDMPDHRRWHMTLTNQPLNVTPRSQGEPYMAADGSVQEHR